MGLGLLGRGIGDSKFLAQAGADLIVTDLKSEAELAPALKELEGYKNIKFVLGRHDLADFANRDLILKAAGVPFNSPYLAEAKKNKIPVVMSTALFVKLADIQTIGVTGTRGKSTTTQLIYEILRAAGKRVWLGGNVRGMSTLALLPEVKSGDIVVLELDSWQLQGFGELKLSPPIAVFTNFFPDHLNYYGGDLERYRADKDNIFKYQKSGDVLLRGGEVEVLPVEWSLQIPGEHNRQNAALAKRVAELVGIDPATIKKVITEFAGVPGRLQLIRTSGGVKIYNDTTSTTPDALRVALKALGTDQKNIILIMGGADKNLDFTGVIPLVEQFCKAVILLPGSGTDKLKLVGAKVTTLTEAVSRALSQAKPGEIILFSPGFASFGLFKNEFARGDQFNCAILEG